MQAGQGGQAADDLRGAAGRVEDLAGDPDGEAPAAGGQGVAVPYRRAGRGEEGGVHHHLVAAGRVPVAADQGVAGPAGVAAEGGQGQPAGQAGGADRVVGFGHVAPGAGLGVQGGQHGALLRGRAREAAAAGGSARASLGASGGAGASRWIARYLYLHGHGGGAGQVGGDPVQGGRQAGREGDREHAESDGGQGDQGPPGAGERAGQAEGDRARQPPGQAGAGEQAVPGVAARRAAGAAG